MIIFLSPLLVFKFCPLYFSCGGKRSWRSFLSFLFSAIFWNLFCSLSKYENGKERRLGLMRHKYAFHSPEINLSKNLCISYSPHLYHTDNLVFGPVCLSFRSMNLWFLCVGVFHSANHPIVLYVVSTTNFPYCGCCMSHCNLTTLFYSRLGFLSCVWSSHLLISGMGKPRWVGRWIFLTILTMHGLQILSMLANSWFMPPTLYTLHGLHMLWVSGWSSVLCVLLWIPPFILDKYYHECLSFHVCFS